MSWFGKKKREDIDNIPSQYRETEKALRSYFLKKTKKHKNKPLNETR